MSIHDEMSKPPVAFGTLAAIAGDLRTVELVDGTQVHVPTVSLLLHTEERGFQRAEVIVTDEVVSMFTACATRALDNIDLTEGTDDE